MNCTDTSVEILIFEYDQKETLSLPHKELSEQDFSLLIKGDISSEASKQYEKEIDFELVRNIELISLYRQNDSLGWDEFQKVFLRDHTLYYLGTYEFKSTNLNLVKCDFSGRNDDQRNSSLYLIAESQNSIWTTPVAVEIDRGWENQILSRTIFANSIFTYQDFSDAVICASYEINDNGEIKVID